MSTISENIIAVTNQKLADQQKVEDAKAAIRLKGVDVPIGTKLGDLDAKIALIDEWVAPADWIQLGEPNDNEILLLASDINPHYSFQIVVSGNFIVDWGDGTVNTWASWSFAQHSYTVGSGQACSRGYTTFKIRIYAQTPANQITEYYTGINTNVKTAVSNGLLQVKFGTRYIGFGNQFANRATPTLRSHHIESIQYPLSMDRPGTNGFSDSYRECFSLHVCRLPLSVKITGINFDQSFNFTKVRKLDLSGFPVIDYFLSAFQSARLIELKLPATITYSSNQGNSFSGVMVDTLILPTCVNNISSAQFLNGFRGRKVVFNSSWENRCLSLNTMLAGCTYLTDVNFPLSVNLSDGVINTFMSGCALIKSFRWPDNIGIAPTSANNLFLSCFNLETVTNFPALSSLTTYGGAFNMCYKLKNIDNLHLMGDTTTGMNHDATYAGCYSLNPAGGLRVRNKITGRFIIAGVDVNNKAALQALLFTNPAAVSTWAGSSPQIDISYCSMEAAALNALFTSIIATSASFSGKTIRITGNPGSATCDTTIITNAGGTVNKTT